ncbi:hypothetical protein EGH21_22575 [Halomicroarcula sp. F13]|uniref:Uncharacterized protein n=1 Tax=Haloarcula rubra TaxID=2487747 RepID=A0AAW4Q054_9EURY|nr:hypothetical protein [Halomicroarcula rubra]MBX0325807.1 hypothetical protein [Halomicroarcula rubra]
MPVKSDTGTCSEPREQEQLWPARRHPDELILPDVHPTRFPGTWVAIFEDTIPNDQRNGLFLEGYHLYRIRLLEGGRAQVIIREEDRPDRDDEHQHDATDQRYEQYDPRKRDY